MQIFHKTNGTSGSKTLAIFFAALLFIGLIATSQVSYANGSSPLAETEWVSDHMKDLKFIYVGFVGEDNKKQYEGKHIAGSSYLGMNDLMSAMTATPNQAKFEEIMGQMGISNDSKVILYGTPAANPFIPGAYWLMKYFGHQNVSIMNGSLDKWEKEGRKTDGTPPAIKPTTYKVSANTKGILADGPYVLNNLKNNGVVLVDTRAADEYTGEKKESYIKASGRIPGAVNLNFYPTNRNGDGTYKSVG